MCGEVGCHRGLAHLGRKVLYLSMHSKPRFQQHVWIHQKTQGERRWGSTCQKRMGETCLEPGAFLAPVNRRRGSWLYPGLPAPMRWWTWTTRNLQTCLCNLIVLCPRLPDCLFASVSPRDSWVEMFFYFLPTAVGLVWAGRALWRWKTDLLRYFLRSSTCLLGWKYE